MPAALDEIVREFAESEPRDRLELLADYARSLPALPASFVAIKDATHLVGECQSPLYLFVDLDGDRVSIHADGPMEAPTPRGFASLLIAGLDGATAEEVLSVRSDLVERLGLPEVLSMLRLRGVSAILARLKAGVVRGLTSRPGLESAGGPS